jgi:hypothetical protein
MRLVTAPHGCKIGSDIDGVRYDQKRHEQEKHPSRQRGGDICRKSAPRVPADQRADQLNRHHQGQRKQ